MFRYFLLSSLVAVALIACQTIGTFRPEPSASLNATPSSNGAVETAQKRDIQSAKSLIRTEPLTPSPIRITVDSLPQPFASNSASKPPNVVPIPENPLLRVPAEFEVNVFAEGLDQPRWLALTPNGDVLVTETRQNRIRLLRDANGDGVAEVRKTFAGPENGLDVPFGMAFSEDSFF